MNDRWFWWLVGVVGVISMMAFGKAIMDQANCVEWKETGSMTCIEAMKGITTCSPDKKCIRWRSDS